MTKVIEIFLFINPLEMTSYNMAKTVNEFSAERSEKVQIRFVPVLNFQSISVQLAKQNIKGASLELRNEIYSTAYEMCLAFEAAAMQGKKTGREFMMSLQESVLAKQIPLTKELVLRTAVNTGLDLEMFEEDWHSEFSKEDFLADQQLAREMDITSSPACVIYNGREASYGCLIETHFTKQLLHGISNVDITDSHTIQDIQKQYKFDFI